MEFKGTKGKFKCVTVHKGLSKGEYISAENQRYFIAEIITFGRTKEENDANKLLLSKAPEMLEMLSSLISVFKRGEFDNKGNIGSDLLNKAQQLIKQATEING